MNNWEYLVRSFCDKFFSGRYIILILSIGTYCFLMSKCLDLVGQKIMTVETFLGLFAGLTGIVSTIVTFYFMRTDRRLENRDQNDPTK